MPFRANITTAFSWDDLPLQVANKVNEIADDQGRNSHGAVTFTNGTKCQHWRAGDYRIFGSFGGTTLTLLAYGQHVGKGSSSYKVELPDGKTRATTS